MDSSSQPTHPARLHVVLARDAHVAVILRRGPSKWVRLIKWSTDTDTFERGQWFNGAIFDNTCDLSPDGEHFVYCARKLNRRNLMSDVGYCWTTVSRPPFLTAVALWNAVPSNGGGGSFQSNNHLSIFSDSIWPLRLPFCRPLKGSLPLNIVVTTNVGSYYDLMLKPRGWHMFGDEGYIKKLQSGVELKQQQLPYDHEFGIEYTLRSRGRDYSLERVEWCDIDHNGRLVFARDGKLYAVTNPKNGIENLEVLADFNVEKPEAIPPPSWALHW